MLRGRFLMYVEPAATINCRWMAVQASMELYSRAEQHMFLLARCVYHEYRQTNADHGL